MRASWRWSHGCSRRPFVPWRVTRREGRSPPRNRRSPESSAWSCLEHTATIPESAAGGLITLLTRAGHEVICAYATSFRGDRKFFDRPEAEVRQAEAKAACKILGATTKFFPYAHEKLVADEKTIKEVSDWFEEVKPDIVVTHWPIDTHPNHNITSTLVWQCYKRSGGWSLYFFEVEGGMQTLAFYPELYVDITTVRGSEGTGLLLPQESGAAGFLVADARSNAPRPGRPVRGPVRRGLFAGRGQARLPVVARAVPAETPLSNVVTTGVAWAGKAYACDAACRVSPRAFPFVRINERAGSCESSDTPPRSGVNRIAGGGAQRNLRSRAETGKSRVAAP